ncbi:MAG: DUF1573 domain-containing protein, partial [Bacteroidota bacterium]
NKDNLEAAKQRDYENKYMNPVMKFDKTEHDFGTIDEGDVVETVFKFTNTGKKELIISKAKASCGCTIPEWPKEPVLPGETGEIKVKFNSYRKPNKQNKVVTLTTNTETGLEKVTIKAFVNPDTNLKNNK